jgi:hypothetical protein
MRGSQLDRDSIRQYLLGRLNDREELESDISETILTDDDVSALVESVEDEIIEAYVEDTLNPADRRAVDNYFLVPAERKKRLQFERLVQNHFEKRPRSFSELPLKSAPEKDPPPAPADIGLPAGQRITNRPSFYLALAALVIGPAIGVTYVSELRTRQASLEHELAQQRSQIANSAQQASPSNLPMIALTLVSERSRGGVQVPSLEIKPETKRIIVEIALSDPVSVPYEIELESKGSIPVWKAKLLPIVSASGDARLVFDVPGKLLEQGHYSFLVASLPTVKSGRSYYDFDVNISH